MKRCTFLVEIGTEELPSKLLRELGKDFFEGIIKELKRFNLFYENIQWFASSCHLAVQLKILVKEDVLNDMKKKSIVVQRKKDDINIHDCNRDLNNQEKISFSNNRYLLQTTQTVQLCYQRLLLHVADCAKEYGDDSIQTILFTVVIKALLSLKGYEMMRWGNVDTAFIRPVRSITILLDDNVISGSAFDINVDRLLYGHQSLGNCQIFLDHAQNYVQVLKNEGQVIVDYNTRKEMIYLGVQKEAKRLEGVVNFDTNNSNLLEEIVALVEWPVVLSGKFDKKFLNLPREVILHIMQYDQKYFSIYDVNNHNLLPYFIFVANTVVKLDNYRTIICGHENVITPRLIDAEFFFEIDRKFRLEDYFEKLGSVLFHSKLGSLRDKSIRIEKLSGWIAEQVGSDVKMAKRAGHLCKCDLMSNMVFEFPSTQGTIGMYYAMRDGEFDKVALAQKEYYQPKFSDDILPETDISCIVSIADKIDTVVGIFGIQEFPKGNRDPFALKRFAIGMLRIMIIKKLSINLLSLIRQAVYLYGTQLININVVDDVYSFINKRLYFWFFTKGYKACIIESVLTLKLPNISGLDVRMDAVRDFCVLKKDANIRLCIVNKRILNIFAKKEFDNLYFDDKNVKNVFLCKEEEIRLYNQTVFVEKRLEFLINSNCYYDALMILVILLDPIEKFFENVVILDRDNELCFNRLILLNKVKNLFLRVVNFSMLHGRL